MGYKAALCSLVTGVDSLIEIRTALLCIETIINIVDKDGPLEEMDLVQDRKLAYSQFQNCSSFHPNDDLAKLRAVQKANEGIDYFVELFEPITIQHHNCFSLWEDEFSSSSIKQ